MYLFALKKRVSKTPAYKTMFSTVRTNKSVTYFVTYTWKNIIALYVRISNISYTLLWKPRNGNIWLSLEATKIVYTYTHIYTHTYQLLGPVRPLLHQLRKRGRKRRRRSTREGESWNHVPQPSNGTHPSTINNTPRSSGSQPRGVKPPMRATPEQKEEAKEAKKESEEEEEETEEEE